MGILRPRVTCCLGWPVPGHSPLIPRVSTGQCQHFPTLEVLAFSSPQWSCPEKSHSVQFSPSVVSNSLQPHEPQHARPPCPPPTPGVHPNPCPSSWCCHPIISSSVVPFSSYPQSFPESGSFQMSQLFASGGQSIGVSASTSVLPMNTQDCSPLGWSSWISLAAICFQWQADRWGRNSGWEQGWALVPVSCPGLEAQVIPVTSWAPGSLWIRRLSVR